MKKIRHQHKHVITQEPVSKEAQQEPPLVGCFKNAVKGVCGLPAGVRKTTFPAFTRIQDRLDSLGISYDRYAWTVIKTLWPYCQEKHLYGVPVPMFLADSTFAKFAAMQDSTVRINMQAEQDWHRKVHDELTAAMAFIGAQITGKPVPLYWVRSMCNTTGEEKVVQEVMSLLNMLYDSECANYMCVAMLLGKKMGFDEKLAKRVS